MEQAEVLKRWLVIAYMQGQKQRDLERKVKAGMGLREALTLLDKPIDEYYLRGA